MRADMPGEDFVLTVIDVFNLTGRGTAVIGRIESGILRTGETVEIRDDGKLIATARATIEMITSRRADPRTITLLLGNGRQEPALRRTDHPLASCHLRHQPSSG